MARALPHQGPAGAGQTELAAEDEELLNIPGRDRQKALNRLLFPGPTKDFEESREEFGDLTGIPTLPYLYGLLPNIEQVITLDKGVTLIATMEAIGEPDKKGKRVVMTQFNGAMRPVRVRDRSIKADIQAAERADATNPGHVAAPFSGAVSVRVAEGDTVNVGDPVAVIEAMKMEAAINAPISGVVERVVVTDTVQAEGGDLLLVVKPV